MPRGRSKTSMALLPIVTMVFVALTCVTIVGSSAWREWEARQIEIDNAEIDLANLARSLAQHAEDTFELADSILTGMVGRLESEGTSPASIAKLQTVLDLRRPKLGRVHGLLICDENGRWLASTEKGDFATLSSSDRDYLEYHRAVASTAPRIDRPVKSKIRGEWVVPVSRRFNHPDGSFAGVAVASIDANYFADFYRQFDLGTYGSAMLMTSDAIVLARTPGNENNIGRDLSHSRLFIDKIPLQKSAAYQFVSSLDGLQRLGFFDVNDRFGFVVGVTRTQGDVLAKWKSQARARLTVVFGLVILIALLGLYLVRQLYKGRRMSRQLAAKEADFRILAEGSSDMVTRIALDGTLRYVSPSAQRLFGWRPEQLVGTHALAGAHPDDIPQLEEVAEQLRSGSLEEARMVYRTRHRDRGEIWVETTMRVTKSASGNVDGVVAITRDITEHKDIEERLEALAIQDALTGLANRRHFDDRLQQEWARARREGTTLALLMIDADHFKPFNDRYGHPAGDACLQAIAKVLAENAKRPGDLAARYGGEEFAVLLPNTDAAGCRRIGGRIRAKLAELKIPHELNPPGLYVTVSIGGATVDVRTTRTAIPSAIVRAADAALYTAKHEGRNRMVMSGELRAVGSTAVA